MKNYVFGKILALKLWVKNKVGFNDRVRNLGWNGQPKPRVLLSYLSDALRNDVSSFKYNTNRHECLVIVSSLIKSGCIVDVVDCKDDRFVSEVEYDYIIGFGAPYRSAKLKARGKRVFYCTEKHPCYSLNEEKKRIDYLYERHGVKWDIQRSGKYYIESDYSLADEYIVMGSRNISYIRDLYELPSSKFHLIEPTAIIRDLKITKKIQRGFLWLGSRGVVHKGLDLLIESFLLADIDCELHVCGAKKDDVSFLGSMLDDRRVVFHGVIDVNSDYFDHILERVQYVVLPSCSEGIATGVLTGMGCGLIPVVTSACDINVESVGFEIDSIKIESISNVLKVVHSQVHSNIKKLSDNSMDRVKEHNSLVSFEKNIDRIFTCILQVELNAK